MSLGLEILNITFFKAIAVGGYAWLRYLKVCTIDSLMVLLSLTPLSVLCQERRQLCRLQSVFSSVHCLCLYTLSIAE